MKARLLDLLAFILARLPMRPASALCWALAWLWWTVVPVRREVARDNIARALPELDPGSHPATLRRSFHDIALGYVELLRFLRDPRAGAAMVRSEGLEPLQRLQREGRPALVLQGHFGAWDLALLAHGRGRGVRLACVVKPPADPWSAALVERARRLCDIDLIPPRGSMERVYTALEAGRIVVFAMDQRFNEGIAAPFLGRPALTATGLAAAARRTGAPVFPAWQWREGPGRHVLRADAALDLTWTDDAEADIARTTVRFNEILGDRIRERPHGWLWLHRRWRESGDPL